MSLSQRSHRHGEEQTHVDSSRVVHPGYLEKYQNDKKSLLRRMRQLARVLHTDETIEPDSPEWPGLAALATLLVEKFIDYRDKEVRLYAALCCMEIFAIYAPECPFDEAEILVIFRQVITQLANLAHTTDPCQLNYKLYYRMLELLAQVKIGVILVELTKTMQDDEERPLELLTDLVHTLLDSVRNDHPKEILEMVEQAIEGCLDEYEGHGHAHAMPIPLLDELLIFIGHGQTQWVVNPNPQAAAAAAAANKKKKKGKKNNEEGTSRALMVEQPYPGYIAAATLVQKSLNRLATPIANLLNGLLNGESHIVERSNIQSATASLATESSSNITNYGSDPLPWPKDSVYSIIYELHRIAPPILTTVMGTLSAGLSVPDASSRTAVTELLGRLFASPDCSIAKDYKSHFREWVARQNDVEAPIRKLIVKYCVLIQQQQQPLQQTDSDRATIIDLTNKALINLVTIDPSSDVRLTAIEQICTWGYQLKSTVSVELLQAVGSRTRSKNKEERKNAVTGLGQIFFRRYVKPKLSAVQAGGDDCDVGVILEVLHDTCDLDRYRHGRRRKSISSHHDDEARQTYGWIPRLVFETSCLTDKVDSDARSRVIQIIDELLLGSDLSSNESKKLTPTARAVGLTMILDSIAGEGESLLSEAGSSTVAFNRFRDLFSQRARLQNVIGDYIESRAKANNRDTDTEEAVIAGAKARELLELASTLSAPVTGSKKSSPEEVLQAFHGARDRNIFRFLSAITDPLQKSSTRARALEELPKRTKSLGDPVSTWVRTLIRRCVMGDFINADIIGHCVLLAQECFFEEDIQACAALLGSVKTAVSLFPSLCSPANTFSTLTELLSDALAVTSKDLKKQLDESGIVSAISSLLSTVDPNRSARVQGTIDKQGSNDKLYNQLLQLCTHKGTPEQARNAVYTLVRVVVPASNQKQSPKSPEQIKKPAEAFSSILKALTSPSRMTISDDEDKSTNIISILSALSALADSAPEVFASGDRGRKAILFALETILMGRGHSTGDSSDEDTDDSDNESDDGAAANTPTNTRKKRARGSAAKKRLSQKPSRAREVSSLVEDENLSISCRRVCAAIEFIVSFIRSTIFAQRKSRPSAANSRQHELADDTDKIFSLLTQILSDKGLPPSNRDRRACKSREDRGALRQCAAIHLLRLCDPRLCLEKKHLTLGMWHTLGEAFLDSDPYAREAVLKEFSQFLVGNGVYGSGGSPFSAQAPALRFVAFITLCSDGAHGDNDAANGNASNMGKLVSGMKNSALQCVESLRKVCDAAYARCKTNGAAGEKMFDSQFKKNLMPEFMVPYAFHLLAHRRETPCSASAGGEEVEGGTALMAVDDESQRKVLKKRLSLLFEPLVKSLEVADNISFLFRMSELVAKNFRPVDASGERNSSSMEVSIGSDSSMDTKPRADDERAQMLTLKLKAIAAVSRDVLLSFVKKDVNLSTYPGIITVPNFLFHRVRAPKKRPAERLPAPALNASQSSGTTLSSSEGAPPLSQLETVPSIQDSSKKRKLSPTQNSEKKQPPLFSGGTKISRQVHFSPELELQLTSSKRAPASGDGAGSKFDGISPIPNTKRSKSPADSGEKSAGETTLGSQPPSGLKTSTMLSTAPDAESEDGSQSSPLKNDSPGDTGNLVGDRPASTFPSQQDRSRRRSQRLSQSQSQDSEPSKGSTLTKSPDELHTSKGSKKKSSTSRKEDGPGTPAVPKHISISRPASGTSKSSNNNTKTSAKRSRSSAKPKDDHDYGHDDEPGTTIITDSENRPSRPNSKKRGLAASGASRGTKASNNKSEGSATVSNATSHRRRRRRIRRT